MIDFRPSSDCKTVITWQGEHCEAVVDVGTVDATSAVQLKLLLQNLGVLYPKIHLEFNEYKNAIVQWRSSVVGEHAPLGRAPVVRDLFVARALEYVAWLQDDITDYNHYCAIMETAEEAKAA